PIAYDERIHFAMHSACRSSPPLRVFDGGQLDVQFEDAATGYVRRSVRIEAGGAVVVVPRLLRWYAADFGGERGVLEFVLTRLEDEAAVDLVDRRRGRVKLQYAAFDWALNRREASDGNRSCAVRTRVPRHPQAGSRAGRAAQALRASRGCPAE